MIDVQDESILRQIEEIKRAAAGKTGLNNFGEPHFEEPLYAWLKDLQGANLNDFGRQFLRRLAFNDLCRRLKVMAYLAEHPEISEVKIPPILLIMAAPRTGTTLLHNLMAFHPLARPLLRWELMEPLPPPTLESYGLDPRIAKVQASIEPLRGSLLERMHWVNADEPEENTWGFLDCTGLLGRSILAIMPTWSQWLEGHDHRTTFREFRKLLQLLIWKCPPPEGGHLLLKCVLTTANIQRFADEFPEARFILVHRDPFRIVVSAATLSDGLYQPFLSRLPGPIYDDGLRERGLLRGLGMMLGAMVEFKKNEPERVASVQYSELMTDAVRVTRLAYEYFGIQVPENLEQRIVAFLLAQRSGKRGTPPKKYSNFGYDPETVWGDPTVSEYCKFFGVEREERRLVDTQTGS